MAETMSKNWPELFQDLIEAGLGKPLFAAALMTLGVVGFLGLGGVPEFMPEIIPIVAAVMSLILLGLGLVILLRWISNLL